MPTLLYFSIILIILASLPGLYIQLIQSRVSFFHEHTYSYKQKTCICSMFLRSYAKTELAAPHHTH